VVIKPGRNPSHQQSADELGGDHIGKAGEEGLGEVLGSRGGGEIRFRVR